MQRTNILRTFVLLITQIGLLSFQLVLADKKQKEWPPMPPLDTLIGDTAGAITIRDSALIPTFGIYPVGEWGRTAYIDTNTFKKYGLTVFFDPWDDNSRKYIETLNALRNKLENEWGFQVFLVASQMSITSCQKYLFKNNYPMWKCEIFFMPDFPAPYNSADSLKRILASFNLSFPICRLKQPIRLLDTDYRFSCPADLIVKGKYVVDFASTSEGMWSNKVLAKMLFSLAAKELKRWKYSNAKGGD